MLVAGNKHMVGNEVLAWNSTECVWEVGRGEGRGRKEALSLRLDIPVEGDILYWHSYELQFIRKK